MFAIWEPQRVFTWSVIQKKWSAQEFILCLFVCLLPCTCAKISFGASGRHRDSKKVCRTLSKDYQMSGGARDGKTQIFSVAGSKTRSNSGEQSKSIRGFLVNTSVPITSVAVPIISRCRFSRCASVRKSILTAVCRLEICNYRHWSVTRRVQGVSVHLSVSGQTLERTESFHKPLNTHLTARCPCSFPPKTKILPPFFCVCGRTTHQATLPGATLILTLVQ